jgi:hypothetical protein
MTLGPDDTVAILTNLLALNVDHLPSELRLICNGKNISSNPRSTLASLGLQVGAVYKLRVIRRPVTHTWLRTTVHVLCSSFPPMQIPMHFSSSAADVKREVRYLLRIPGLCLSFHHADGKLLSDRGSLWSLGVRDGGRLYCRIHTEDPPPVAAVDAERVREQILRATAGGVSDAGGWPGAGDRSGRGLLRSETWCEL